MAGETPEDVRTGNSDEFLSKSKWERFQVLIMGPVMNILLAFVLTAVVLYQGVEKAAYEDEPPVVGVITAGSPASKADIKVGDKVIAVAGHAVSTWEDFLIQIGARPNREVEIRLLRGGFDVTTKVTPTVAGQSRFEFGDI